MKRGFQLIVRFAAEAELASLDIEDDIAAAAVGNPLDDDDLPHMVDGNEYGGDVVDIYLDTADPHGAAELLVPFLQERGLAEHTTIASRPFDEDSFLVLWPKDFSGRFEQRV